MIKKEISIMELLQRYPILTEKLKALGMGCSCCMGAMTETLEQGIKAHGLDLKQVLKELNAIIEQDKSLD